VDQIDQLWVVECMKTVDAGEARRGREWLEGLLGDRLLYDGEMLTPEILETQLRLYLAVRELNEENGFAYCGIKGQRELTEYVCIADVAEMLLNDPYDWRGPKEPTVCATEADANAAITMQLLKIVSGGLPSLFMDVRLYHPDLDVWDFCNSGQHASWYAEQSDDPRRELRQDHLPSGAVVLLQGRRRIRRVPTRKPGPRRLADRHVGRQAVPDAGARRGP
jgi:L-fucose isomerase